MNAGFDRYSRQMLFSGWGLPRQESLARGKVLLCGCGALGTVLAETLVRAGVGHLRIVDRDFVDLSNLQRQVLFDEVDWREHLPKAIAAERKLKLINQNVTIEVVVADVGPENILEFAEGTSLLLDGTDNFETRFLINDVSLELGIPWIYTGCIGSHGQVMPVFPGESACLRCLIDGVPPAGSVETCDTAGILGPTVNIIASLEAVQAMKILSGQADQVERVLHIVDVWDGTWRKMKVAQVRDGEGCPSCVRGERRWLRGERSARTTILCGRNSVQITPPERQQLNLTEIAAKWKESGTVLANPYLVRLTTPDASYQLSLFGDGRCIVQGTSDPAEAKTLYARYVGT